jgi:hypothetical protein
MGTHIGEKRRLCKRSVFSNGNCGRLFALGLVARPLRENVRTTSP